MALGSYTIIIILSTVVILSYIFSLISRKTNIPSVLLLIASGIALKELVPNEWHYEAVVNKLVKILGAIGLIMIVLEAALDLKINRGKIKLIRNSFSSALFIFLISAFGIGLLIMQLLGVPLENAFIYAVPLSIISSSVAIPSAERLPEEKREFVIYESSFSDILGILLFNYLLMDDVLSLRAVGVFFGNVGLAIIISIIASLLLIYTLTQSKTNIRFFLVFAILALIYSLGEQIHLPSLLIVLVFGLVFNNNELILRGRLKAFLHNENIDGILSFLKSITAETSFLLRTFFFILFGYTIDLRVLIREEVWQTGSLIVLILFAVRFLYLRFILKSNLFPELFLMPRGLITILLLYSIPASKSLGNFNAGILFFVVVVTSLLMMLGLLFYKDNKKELLEKEI